MLAKKLAIDNIPHLIKNSRVLMRVDFNVPLKDGKVSDPKRITATMPSIDYTLKNGAKSLVLMSHLGRPDGMRKPEFSLQPVVPALEDLLQKKVTWLPDCMGDHTLQACAKAKDGEVILLENLRFYPAEEGKGKNEKGEKVKASSKDVSSFR